jgi:hypothetical protein
LADTTTARNNRIKKFASISSFTHFFLKMDFFDAHYFGTRGFWGRRSNLDLPLDSHFKMVFRHGPGRGKLYFGLQA